MQFLGDIYLNGGPGVNVDGQMAFRWYLRASDEGKAGALFSLGKLFEDGMGTSQNLELALNCYRKAAEQGDPEAQMRLSELFMRGWGATADLVEALKWLAVGRRARLG
jgi:hypothetical protein